MEENEDNLQVEIIEDQRKNDEKRMQLEEQIAKIN